MPKLCENREFYYVFPRNYLVIGVYLVTLDFLKNSLRKLDKRRLQILRVFSRNLKKTQIIGFCESPALFHRNFSSKYEIIKELLRKS